MYKQNGSMVRLAGELSCNIMHIMRIGFCTVNLDWFLVSIFFSTSAMANLDVK